MKLFISYSLALFISLSLGCPSVAHAGLYKGKQFYQDGLGECISPSACKQYSCGTGMIEVPLGGCPSYGYVCCQAKAQAVKTGDDCLGSCVPQSECGGGDPGGVNGGAGKCTTLGHVCCGVLKKAEAETQPQAGSASAEDTPVLPATVTQSSEGRTCPTPVAGVRFPCQLGEGTAQNISSLVGQIIRWVLGLVGALFLGIFVWGGILYLTAGSSKRAEEGQKTLVNASIGMAIIVFSYLFLDWVLQGIGTAMGGS